ncbi:MAG TPA: hypothetical protein VL689_10550 [Paraburkholderia sp.]|nr:hypothetical protein [Paraburkholderia sp.]
MVRGDGGIRRVHGDFAERACGLRFLRLRGLNLLLSLLLSLLSLLNLLSLRHVGERKSGKQRRYGNGGAGFLSVRWLHAEEIVVVLVL